MSTHPSLRDALGDYLALRRALGFKLANAGRLLGQFVDHLNERGVGSPTIDDALTWANLPASASGNWRAIRLPKSANSRLVPLPSTPPARLAAYIPLRDQTLIHPLCPALLVSGAGTRLHHSNVGLPFAQLPQRVGIPRRSAACRPRMHD